MGSLTLIVAAATDTGRKREHNEDSHALWIPDDPGERERRGVLLVVSDGMGGSQAGEVASRLTVETVLRAYRDGSSGEPREDLRAAIEEANRAVHGRSSAEPGLNGMGATCTALAARGRDAWVAHVGDSRAYLARNGRIRQLTQDHSLVAQLVERRQLTPAEARVDPRRNVVTRSIGIAETVEVDLFKLDAPLESDDVLLLCSDGLHGVVTDDELAAATSARDLEQASGELIALANRRGGPDNITVVLARLRAHEDAPGASPDRGRDPGANVGARGTRRSSRRTLWLLILALVALVVAVAAGLWGLSRLQRESARIETTSERAAQAAEVSG